MKYPLCSSLCLFSLLGGLASQESAPAPGALLELRLLASDRYDTGGVSFDLGAEQKRLRAWLGADDNAQRVRRDPWAVDRFNGLATDAGGALSAHVRWYPHVIRPLSGALDRWEFAYASNTPFLAVGLFNSGEYAAGPTKDKKRLVELLPVNMHASGFTGFDIDASSVRLAQGPKAEPPSVVYSVLASRRAEYADWTEGHVGEHCAVIVRRELRSAPRLMARIDGPAVIAGNFTAEEAEEFTRDLREHASMAKGATNVVVPDDGGAVPTGTDPADLRAMQGAQAMLAAEQRLRDLIKSGKITGIDRILTFEEISSWPYEDGLLGIPKQVKKLDSKNVLMTGFMLPIDEVEDIKEFLLVQSLWSCCFGQPPDINGFVRVVMKGDARIDYQFDPIKVTGTFKVEATSEDGYCVDIYQVIADSVEVIH